MLGGGLAEAGDTLLDPLRDGAARSGARSTSCPTSDVAELGDEAGCHGAALLALDLIEADGREPGEAR